jgi:hypothetical protein
MGGVNHMVLLSLKLATWTSSFLGNFPFMIEWSNELVNVQFSGHESLCFDKRSD